MLTVSRLVARKQEAGTRGVATVSPETTVLEAARIMNDERIGSLVVTGPDDAVIGIITERDLLRRVIAEERSPADTRVKEVMTREVLTCGPDTRLSDLRVLMRDKRIRHMPVCDGGRLVSMISIGDLNFAETCELTEHLTHLETYIRSA